LARPGHIAVASQSGAFGTYCTTLLHHRGAGISQFIATGNEADVDLADCIEWLADDPGTDVIMLSLEGCADGQRLRRAMRRAGANGKRLLAMKVGTSALGAAAAASHTGALAGSDAPFAAAFEEAGVFRAASIDEMVDVAIACAGGRYPRGRKLGVLTLSGGVGVLMADAAAEEGLELPAMPESAQEVIRALIPFAATRNPVDPTAQVSNDRSLLTRVIDVMAEQGGFDATVGFLASMGQNEAGTAAVRPALEALRARHPDRLFILSFLCSLEQRRELEAAGFLVVEDPTRAVRLVAALTRLGPRPLPLPPPEPISTRPLPAGPADEAVARHLLAGAGIPLVPGRIAHSAAEAGAIAAEMGGRIALKVLSPDLPHKSDVGGVRLGLQRAAETRAAWDTMMTRVRQAAPQARITGALISPMVEGGVETVLGMQRDPSFGPVIMFGLGGVFVELFRDVTFRLTPLDRAAALAQIRAIRGLPLLLGARGRPPVDLGAIADALVALAGFALAHPEAESIEINPFIALPRGGLAVDAVILRVAPPALDAAPPGRP
jgi:acyl-CoA synthetase (NDP forming)